jgi:hypothetical protein
VHNFVESLSSTSCSFCITVYDSMAELRLAGFTFNSSIGIPRHFPRILLSSLLAGCGEEVMWKWFSNVSGNRLGIYNGRKGNDYKFGVWNSGDDITSRDILKVGSDNIFAIHVHCDCNRNLAYDSRTIEFNLTFLNLQYLTRFPSRKTPCNPSRTPELQALFSGI